jgi:DNA-binding transcriptional LysR family regulator
MDRIEAMTVFVAVADAGGFAAAARRLGKSPASITRAVAFLEDRMKALLLRRTTRVVKLTEAGERYLVSCRRILAELDAAEHIDAKERAIPRGLLTITAPVTFGRLHVRPLVETFLETHLEVQARLLLLDRLVRLVDEGVDVAIRIAHMPDSALMAIKVGEVQRVVCASPTYLAIHSPPKKPTDLASHTCISFSDVTPNDTWTFAARAGRRPKQVKVHPRFTVNGSDAAIASAREGRGITRVISYQVEHELRVGKLVRLLAKFEPEPLPVHVVYPAASGSNAKVRAFIDLIVPRLKRSLAELT